MATAPGTPQADPAIHPLRIGVIGLGYWGPNVIRNLHELSEAELAYICDRRPEALQRLGSRYPGVPQTMDAALVLADDSVEAVALTTPVATHYPLATAALRAGKHVFVEKPLAGSSQEARELIELADSLGLVIMAGHTYLYSTPVNVIQDLITSGQLGDVYSISMSRVNLGIHQHDVSVIWDLAPHDLSILLYWLGETPTSVSALARACIIRDKPDVAFINMGFPSGTIANVELSWLAPSKIRRGTIVGSRRMVVYDDTSLEPVRIFNSGVTLKEHESFAEYQLSYRAGDIVSPRVDVVEPLLLEMRDFYSAVRFGTTPRSSPRLGLRVVEIIEAVERSIGAGGELIELQIENEPGSRPSDHTLRAK